VAKSVRDGGTTRRAALLDPFQQQFARCERFTIERPRYLDLAFGHGKRAVLDCICREFVNRKSDRLSGFRRNENVGSGKFDPRALNVMKGISCCRIRSARGAPCQLLRTNTSCDAARPCRRRPNLLSNSSIVGSCEPFGEKSIGSLQADSWSGAIAHASGIEHGLLPLSFGDVGHNADHRCAFPSGVRATTRPWPLSQRVVPSGQTTRYSDVNESWVVCKLVEFCIKWRSSGCSADQYSSWAPPTCPRPPEG